jgi:hypothetical protein
LTDANPGWKSPSGRRSFPPITPITPMGFFSHQDTECAKRVVPLEISNLKSALKRSVEYNGKAMVEC